MSSEQARPFPSSLSPIDTASFDPVETGESAAVWSALSASSAAATIGVVILLCRLGLENAWAREVSLSVGFAWMVLNFPLLVSRRSGLGTGPRTALALLAGLAACFWLGPTAGIACATLGLLSLALVLVRRHREHELPRRQLALAGLAIGILVSSITLGRGYLTPTLDVGLEAAGNVHVDSLFHMSIAGMLRSYGVPSTGLDGLPWLGYHWGSHAAMAALAEGQGTSVVTSYCTGYPIVFGPLFAHALILAGAACVGRRRRRELEGPSAIRCWRTAWFAVVVAIGGFLPSSVGHETGLKPSFLISESMGVGLTLVFLCLSSILPWLQERTPRSPLEVLLLPAAIGLWGVSKVSLMVLAGAAIAWVLLRRPRILTRPLPLAVLALTLVMAAYVNSTRLAPVGPSSVEPLYFLRVHVDLPFWPLFFPATLAWTGLAWWLRCRELRVTDPARLRVRLRQGRLLDLEVLSVVALAGYGVSMSLAIAGGSGVYFHSVQQWLAVAIVVSVCLRGEWNRANAAPGRRWPALRARRVIQALSVILALNVARDLVRMGKDVAADRRAPSSATGGDPLPHRSRASIVACLRHLFEVTPRTERSRSLVYVPPDLEAYWSSTPRQPRAAPFVGPVLTEMAMLQGQPAPVEGVEWVNYGFQLYDVAAGRSALSAERALDHAQQRGFQRVYWVEEQPEGVAVSELCAPGVPPLLGHAEFSAARGDHRD